MVTADAYSHNGRHVLIPQGSHVLGEARRVETCGDTRLALICHRLIMPDGYSVTLDQFHFNVADSFRAKGSDRGRGSEDRDTREESGGLRGSPCR